MSDGAKVMRVAFGQQSDIKGAPNRCRHQAYELDAEKRTVHCSNCDAALDAFQMLLDYADGERRWRGWDTECSRKEQELAQLRAEERKVKARTKAASRKDAATAVAAERARSEKERFEIIQAARDVAELSRKIERITTRRRTTT